jgi:hypothetical protein
MAKGKKEGERDRGRKRRGSAGEEMWSEVWVFYSCVWF